jgi:ligand-binding sensor domain-containing protein
MINRLLIITIVFLLNLFPVFAQPVQYPFSHLDIFNGLSHSQVIAIIKDAKVFMWFGTPSGLNRYDGYTFKVFRHKENDSTSLPDDLISKIQEGPHNKFWINTRGGLCIFDPVSEKAITNTTAYCRQLSLPAAAVTDIAKDKQGRFWFAQPGYGLSRYDPETHTVHRFQRKAVKNIPDITDMVADNAGNLWVMYNDGLLEAYNTATEKLTYSNAEIFKKSDALRYRLFADAENDLWIYTDGLPQGVFCFNSTNNKLLHYHNDAAANRLNTNLVTGIQQDNNGMIWIATDHGGVNLVNKRTGVVSYL